MYRSWSYQISISVILTRISSKNYYYKANDQWPRRRQRISFPKKANPSEIIMISVRTHFNKDYLLQTKKSTHPRPHSSYQACPTCVFTQNSAFAKIVINQNPTFRRMFSKWRNQHLHIHVINSVCSEASCELTLSAQKFINNTRRMTSKKQLLNARLQVMRAQNKAKTTKWKWK